MTVKLPVNITKTEISVYLGNDTNIRQNPGLIFAKLNTYYKFQGKQSTFSKDSFFTRRRKLCKQKWYKVNKYKKILHHLATAYSCPEKDNIGMLPTIEIIFARSLT